MRNRLLLGLALAFLTACTPDGSLTANDRSVRLVPGFRSTAALPTVGRLRTGLVRPGRDSLIQTLSYRRGDWIVLGSVESGDSFTVSLTGLDSADGTLLPRWWISGSGRAGSAAEQTVALEEPVTARQVDTSVFPVTLYIGSKLTLAAGRWNWTLDGSDPRTSSTSKSVRDSMRLSSDGSFCIAQLDSSAGRPALWSEVVCRNVLALPSGNWMQDRAGTPYPTVTLGNQTWMARNLDWLSPESSWTYRDATANPSSYGRLYAWSQAMTACPDGWHLPSKEDWIALLDAYESSELKNDSGWSAGNEGTGSSGFAMIPAGKFVNGTWLDSPSQAVDAAFWSSTATTLHATVMELATGSTVPTLLTSSKSDGYSVRCLKN